MKADLKKAKKLLAENNYTCVFCKGNSIYTNTKRGVRPLLDFIENNRNIKGFSAADKVAGKAAAFLYVLLGVKEVYANVISKKAELVLKQFNIAVYYNVLTDAIINRTNTGFCPMETAVDKISDPYTALKIIQSKIKKMSAST